MSNETKNVSGETRITEAFQQHKAFIPFVTVGDPNLEMTKNIVHALVEAGADLIELGIPFSDPTAEGPVIMKADEIALSAGTTTDLVFDLTKELRAEGITVPFLYMTYANVVFSYGIERFMKAAREAGADGLILPDVPFEEREEFETPAIAEGLSLISMIAPTSEDRIAMIAKAARGFIYVVSSMGVTGVRQQITTDIGAMIRMVKAHTDVPCAVGFGISTPEQAAAMASLSDGAIVGSAIVRQIQDAGDEAAEAIRTYAGALAKAVHSGGTRP